MEKEEERTKGHAMKLKCGEFKTNKEKCFLTQYIFKLENSLP